MAKIGLAVFEKDMSNIQMNDNNQRTWQNVTSQNNTFVWNDRILKEKFLCIECMVTNSNHYLAILLVDALIS